MSEETPSPISYGFPMPTLDSRIKRVERTVQRRRRGQIGAIVDPTNTRFRTVAATSVDQDGNVIVPQSTSSSSTNSIGVIGESEVAGLIPDLAACEKFANKDQAGGYASLDGSSRVPVAEIPPLPYTAAPVAVPATSASAGVAGTWAYDSSFLYICVATSTWMRTSLVTW